MSDLDRYRMTLGELRAALAGFPDDAIVVVNGYEGGYERPFVREDEGALDAGGAHCGMWSDKAESRLDWRGMPSEPRAPLERLVVISREPPRDWWDEP